MQEKGMTADEISNRKVDAKNAVIVIPVIFIVTYPIVALITGWDWIKTIILVSPFFAVLELVALITDKMIDENELEELMEKEYQPHKRKL